MASLVSGLRKLVVEIFEKNANSKVRREDEDISLSEREQNEKGAPGAICRPGPGN